MNRQPSLWQIFLDELRQSLRDYLQPLMAAIQWARRRRRN